MSQSSESIVRQAAVAILNRDDRFLVVQRAAHIRAPNQLCFPGGGIEQGESAHEAVVRELAEEIRLDVQPARTAWTSRSAWGIFIHWVEVDFDLSHPIKPNADEVADFFWMTPSELLAVDNLLSSNRKFFEDLQAGKFQLRS